MREIRPYGSVRGVRRKPYPYRDLLQPMRSSVLFLPVATAPDGSPRRSKDASEETDLSEGRSALTLNPPPQTHHRPPRGGL